MFCAGFTNNLREAFFRTCCGAGPLNIGQFSIRNRTNGLNLKHLPDHRQGGRDTAPAAERIKGGNVEINIGCGAYAGDYFGELLRGVAGIGHFVGVQCRVPVGPSNSAGVEHGHSRFRKLRTYPSGFNGSRELS